MPEPIATPRLDAIRAGIAAGQDMNIFAELVWVIDTVFEGLAAQQAALDDLRVRIEALQGAGVSRLTSAATWVAAAVEADGLVE
jgi:ABC-type Zn2+ transport system substrate-binding protein/surface adhesin